MAGSLIKFDMQSSSLFSSKRHASKANRLTIIDPNRPTNDISGGSNKIGLIFDRFADAHNELLTALKVQDRPSLLDWMLGGDYSSFTKQRAEILKVYERVNSESS